MQDPNTFSSGSRPSSRPEKPFTSGGILEALRIQRQRLAAQSSAWLRKYEARQPILLELPRD